MLQENTKVIQFVDEGIKRRIEKSYYASERDWNPCKQIELYTFEDLPVLQEQGLIFKQNPNRNEKGMSTFVQNPIDTKEFICLEKFGDYVIENQENILIEILRLLGIKDYLISTKYSIGAGFGKKEEGQFSINGKAGVVEGEFSQDKKSFIKAHIELHKFSAHHVIMKPASIPSSLSSPSKDEWKKACYIAKKSGLDKSISYIINSRKPGNNSSLLLDKKVIRMDGDISLNINAASSLKTLVGYKGISAGGGFLSALDFSAYAHGEYETTIIYNFDPNREDSYVKEVFDKELKALDKELNAQ